MTNTYLHSLNAEKNVKEDKRRSLRTRLPALFCASVPKPVVEVVLAVLAKYLYIVCSQLYKLEENYLIKFFQQRYKLF